MVYKCVYCGVSQTADGGRSFHVFPLKESNNELLATWIKNMNIGPQFKPVKVSRLCSDHFEEKCFSKLTKGHLLTGSIPTKFGIYKSSCIYCHKIKGINKDRSYRKFPVENAELLQKWLDAMNLKDVVVTEKSLLCSDHFEAKCFRKTGKNSSILALKSDAVPTLFLRDEVVERHNSQVHTNQKLDSSVSNKREGSPSNVSMSKSLRQKKSGNHDFSNREFFLSEKGGTLDLDVNGTNSPILLQFDSSAQDNLSSSDRNRVKSPILLGLDNSIQDNFSSDIGTPSTRSASTIQLLPKPMTPQTPIALRCHRIYEDHHYEITPRSMKKKFMKRGSIINTLRNESRLQKQKITRLKKRVTSLSDLVREIRKTKLVTQSGLQCLETIAENDVCQLLQRFLVNKKSTCVNRQKYPPALRTFALTLHFYSPKAYQFVRQKFCKALPDISTIRSWYSAIDGEPGFTSESFDALARKVEEAKIVNKRVLVSFMLDGISITKDLQRTRDGKVRGYVDFGTNVATCETLPIATDAYVLMVVALNDSWKIVIGYFLNNGINSETNTNLITEALIRLYNIGVEVVSVTLDGPEEHFSTMKALGATFSMPNPKPYFPHPCDERNVFVVFDPSHMLKLMRNCFGDKKCLKDSLGRLIEWRFIVELAKLQEEEGLRGANKLRLRHIEYWKMKMKVALAAQTLSSSVADCIEFCNVVLNLKQFKGSEATVQFIRCVDRVFDFLNSRNPFGKGYKAPLKTCNENFWRGPMLHEIAYLKGITDITGKPMIATRRYVPFVGFITGIECAISTFDLYVKPVDSPLKYLLTYKLSQDHIELLFCAIRSCGGWNPNPSAREFVSAYKRLLIQHEVKAANGNCESMDATLILTVSSTRKLKEDRYSTEVYDRFVNVQVAKKYGLFENNETDNWENEFTQDFKNYSSVKHISEFSRSCVAYIAGWVVKNCWT